MFIVVLRFGHQKARAAEFMDGHRHWLRQGFDDGVFLLAGSLQPQAGGVVLARGLSAQALHERVLQDPFVSQEVVRAEILEVAPSRAVEQLQFLLSPEATSP